jgi:hypothetical protein
LRYFTHPFPQGRSYCGFHDIPVGCASDVVLVVGERGAEVCRREDLCVGSLKRSAAEEATLVRLCAAVATMEVAIIRCSRCRSLSVVPVVVKQECLQSLLLHASRRCYYRRGLKHVLGLGFVARRSWCCWCSLSVSPSPSRAGPNPGIPIPSIP